MCNRIPVWKKLGKTMGSITIKPNDDIFFYWNEWIKHKIIQKNLNIVSQSSPTKM